MSKKSAYLILLAIIISSLVITSLFYFISNFYPLLSDTAGLACGVKNLVENKTLNNSNFHINFAGINSEVCWHGKTYVLTRILASIFTFLSPKITPWLSLYIFYLIVFAFIPFFVFLVTKQLFSDNKTALVSAFFGAFAPFFARSILVHPQNLIGFLLILIFTLFFIRYFQTKQKHNLFFIALVLLVFPYFHHLSFAVLLMSLFVYLIWRIKTRRLFWYLLGAIPLLFFIYFFISKVPFEFFLNVLNDGIEGGRLWESSIKKPFFEIPSYIGYLLFTFGFLGILKFLLPHYKESYNNSNVVEKHIKKFLFSFLITPLVFSQLYLIGFNFYSFRIIVYAGLPLIIFSGLGFFYLKDLFIKFNLKKLFSFFSILIFLGTVIYYFSYLNNVYQTRSLEYLPQKNFIEAANWLNNHSDKNTTVFSTVERKNKQTISLAYLYKGNVVYFPATYFSNPKKLKYQDLAAESRFNPSYLKKAPQTILGKIILQIPYFKKVRENSKNSASKKMSKLKRLNKFIVQPENYKILNYENNNITYIIFEKDGWADKIYQEKAKFKVVYQNNDWRVYKSK